MSVKYNNMFDFKLFNSLKTHSMTLEFMNGYPRFTIWDLDKSKEDSAKGKIFAIITFTPTKFIAYMDMLLNKDIVTKGSTSLVIDSINHVYHDGKRTDELESRGEIEIVFIDEVLMFLIAHNGDKLIFSLEKSFKYISVPEYYEDAFYRMEAQVVLKRLRETVAYATMMKTFGGIK